MYLRSHRTGIWIFSYLNLRSTCFVVCHWKHPFTIANVISALPGDTLRAATRREGGNTEALIVTKNQVQHRRASSGGSSFLNWGPEGMWSRNLHVAPGCCRDVSSGQVGYVTKCWEFSCRPGPGASSAGTCRKDDRLPTPMCYCWKTRLVFVACVWIKPNTSMRKGQAPFNQGQSQQLPA